VPAPVIARLVRRVAHGARESHVEEYNKLRELVEGVEEDVRKAMGGNKAAGTRVRKVMQEIKNMAQAVRKRVLEIREAEGSSAGKPPQP
jgi:predicted AAA+ superfamily ATPase